jgi:hypothetical protein
MWLIPKGTELSNVAETPVGSQDFTVRVRAYSEEDLWEVKGNLDNGNESWKFGLNGNVLSLTVGAETAECDVRANLTHHINDFVVTYALDSLVTFYVNGTSVKEVSGTEIGGFAPWTELVISGDGSPQTLLDRVTLDFGDVWLPTKVTAKFAADMYDDSGDEKVPKSVKHTFRGTLDEFQVQGGGSEVTYGNVEGRDTVVVIPAGKTLTREVELDAETMTVRVKATTNPWRLVGSNVESDTDSWEFALTEGNVLSFAVNDGTGTMVESNVDLTGNVEFVENELLEYVVNVTGVLQTPDLFFQGHVLSLQNSNNAPALPPSNLLSLSSPSPAFASHLDLLDLSFPSPLSKSLLSILPSPSPFLSPSLPDVPDVPRIVYPNIEDVGVGRVRVHFNLGNSGDFTFHSANVVVTEFQTPIQDITILETDIDNGNVKVGDLVNGNVYDFTIRTTYTDLQEVLESANVSHTLPTLPDRWFISNVHDTGSGNVRVQFVVGANNDFQFATANIVVHPESGPLVHNAKISDTDIDQGNVGVTGLAEGNVYDFTIETFFDQPFGYPNVSNAYNKELQVVETGPSAKTLPEVTTIDEIVDGAEGNVRVQYKPGANNDFTFVSANVTAVTEDSGGENRYTAIDDFDEFNLGNVYVDGLTEGSVYDFTIEVFYSDGVTTSNVYENYPIPISYWESYARDVYYNTITSDAPDADLSKTSDAGGRYGRACSLSADGKTALITGEQTTKGGGYIWKRNDSGTWEEYDGNLNIEKPSYGYSSDISADGKTAIIMSTNFAYIWTNDSSTTEWINSNILVTQRLAGSDACSMSADGTTMLISSSDDGDSGKAYIWTKNDDGSWEEYSGNLNKNSGAGGRYGYACALSADGKTALITGHNTNDDSGCAYIWTKQANGSWAKYSGNLNIDSGAGGRYGHACALSADGKTALITGQYNNDSGCAYIWTKQANGSWARDSGNLNSTSGAGGNYGIACALSADGKTALVSGPKDYNSGCAYLWTKNEITGKWLVSVPSLYKNTVNTPGLYGQSCSLADDGKTALIAGYIWAEEKKGCAFVWYGNVHDDPPTTSTKETWDVSERQRAYSSYDSDFRFSTLASNTCWRDANAAVGGWIQMDLGQPYNVYGIVIAGNANVETNEWVTNVDIETSTDGTTWPIRIANVPTNTDANVETVTFTNAIQTQHVRIVVNEYNGYPSMRVALMASDTSNDVPAVPEVTTIDEIFNEAPGNVRVQYSPGANMEYTFLSANVTAVTEDSGGENRYTAIDDFDEFNLGNVYVDGITKGNVYDFTIEVFYSDGVTTSSVYENYRIPISDWESYARDVYYNTITSGEPDAELTLFSFITETNGRKIASCSISADGKTAFILGNYWSLGTEHQRVSKFIKDDDGDWTEIDIRTYNGDNTLFEPFATRCCLSKDGTTGLITSEGSSSIYIFDMVSKIKVDVDASTYLTGIKGSSISADGRTVLISNWDSIDSGKAYIWTRDESDNWTRYAGNLNKDSGAGGRYGHACALSADGKTALITGHPDPDSGCGYIWTKQDGIWEEYHGNLNIESGARGGYGFACALSADGNTALITGTNPAGGGNRNWDGGCAYIWTKQVDGNWVQYSGNLNIDAGAGGRYGVSCSLSADGKTALVSGHKADNSGGCAYVWTKNEITREWLVSVPNLNVSNIDIGRYGWACALSDDGKTALITGPDASFNTPYAFVWYGNVHDDPPTTSTEETWDVSERQRAYSSYDSDFRFSTLVSNTCWRDATAKAGGWIQMDLGQTYTVHGIVIAGHANVEFNEWVTNVDIETSTDGTTWPIRIANVPTNTDANNIETVTFTNAIQTQHVRIVVNEYNGYPSMRVALMASDTSNEVPAVPEVTTIDRIVDVAEGNVRVQYSPGANNDFDFVSANVTAVTEYNGGENRYTAIENFDEFNLGNVYVDGLTEGSVYDFTIEVFYNAGVTTNIAIRVSNPVSGNKYYLDDVLQDTVHLNVGDTLVFTLDEITMSDHPLWIETEPNTNGANYVSSDEVTNNGARSDEIRWTPTIIGTYYYNCQYHTGMGGLIEVSGNPTQTITSNVKHGYPVVEYSTDTIIDRIVDGAEGNVRVQYRPGVNKYFDFVSANVDAVTLDGGANVNVVINEFDSGNVYVNGLTEGNVYDFTINVFYSDGVTTSSVYENYRIPISDWESYARDVYYNTITSDAPDADLSNSVEVIAGKVYGHACALSADGKTALITGYHLPNVRGGGYILKRNDLGSWEEYDGNLNIEEKWYGDSSDISADGKTAIIMARTNVAYIWTNDSSITEWMNSNILVTQRLTRSDACSISADGTTVLISQFNFDSDSGKAYIWTKNDDGIWEEYAGNLNIESGAGGRYGYACALSADGKTALITGLNTNDSGCAYIWTKNDDGIWEEYAGNLNITSGAGGNYGLACALSADGKTALITGQYDNDSGCAYIWTKQANGSWARDSGNLNITSGAGGNYGVACALSADGNTALVSGHKANNISGCAYIWTKNEITKQWLVSVPSLNKNTSGYYGYSCSLADDGKTALITGPDYSTSTGCAFVWYGNVHDDPPTTSTEETWDVSERQRAYSSYDSDFRFSTLASNTCWRDATATTGGWIQMDLGQPYNVYGIMIAGNANIEANEWVTNVDIETSTNDGETWPTHVTNLVTNTDATEKTARFNAIQTQHVRIVVKTYNGYPSMRVALMASNI